MADLKKYEKPEMEIFIFCCEDVLTTSGSPPDPGNDGEWDMLDGFVVRKVF